MEIELNVSSFFTVYANGISLHVHQFEKAKLASFLVEEQIDLGILAPLPARGGPEQIKAKDADRCRVIDFLADVLDAVGETKSTFCALPSNGTRSTILLRRVDVLSDAAHG